MDLFKNSNSQFHLLTGDCLEVMKTLDAESVDSIVTDPPYGLSFMGKGWDHGVPGKAFWREALRVAKPGAHLLAFGGTRTFHRLACAIEDAGWEIRDCVMWVYGTGFPKSHDVSKAIDKTVGAEREVVGIRKLHNYGKANADNGQQQRLTQVFAQTSEEPATDAARQWQGWGTALKPAWEPVIVARKPFKSTVAANVLEHGTGGINVDGCRVAADDGASTARARTVVGNTSTPFEEGVAMGGNDSPLGRWPANLIHDGSEEVVGLLGSAARFFYCAKASKRDRDEGCEGFVAKANPKLCDTGYESPTRMDGTPCSVQRNRHPTVKPTALMRYLCRLVTPPGGIVLDPFMGSGSTGKAAILEGFRFIGIEKEPEYVEIAQRRISHVVENQLTTLEAFMSEEEIENGNV